MNMPLEEIMQYDANMDALKEFIEHHGVKGMRWGVRNSASSSGGSIKKAVGSRVQTAKKRRKPTSEAKKVAELKKRKPQALTNKQLKTVNERMNLEKNFSKLNPSTIKKGHNAVKGIVALTATIGTLYAFANSPAGQHIRKIIESKIAQEQVKRAILHP